MTLIGLTGCDKKHQSLAGIGAGDLPPGHVDDPCASHQTGCACTPEGSTVECGTVEEKIGEYVMCSEGTRTCSSGQWGDCIADHEEKKPLVYHAPMQGGYTLEGLGASTSCNNPCDPGCQNFVDDANGLSVDVDLSAGPNGVTLPGSPGGGGGMICNNMQLTPKTKTVTVTAIASDGTITATPSNGKIDFDATCSGGTTTEPSWTLDSYDRATVSSHGIVTVYSGVAGPIQVTGQGPSNSDTAVLTVVDVIGDTPVAAGSTADPGAMLYPYNTTLFPLGLKAPLVQWTEGGITPTQTQTMLCYPKNTCAKFQYVSTWPSSSTSTTLKEPRDGSLDNTVPAWQIPQQIWSAFDRSASGDTGQIIVRRQVGSTKYAQLSIDVQFATDALRGTVYYTQYLKSLHTSDSQQSFNYSATSYVPGQTCQVGNNTHPSTTAGSQTRAIDLSTYAATNTDPFAAGGTTAGCPVCHSISANGSIAVSGGKNWQTSGGGTGLGVNSIGLNSSNVPAFTGLFDAPNYSAATTADGSGEDSRGFSYGAITPDGGVVLQGPNFWGSTTGTPSANNTQNADFLGVAGQPKPYFFVSTKSPNPGFGVQFATTGALPTYSASATSYSGTPCGTGTPSSVTLTTLTGSGTLTVDGYSMGSTSYSLLVKDETGANAKYNGIYTVYATSPWKLRQRCDAYSTTAVKAQSEARISDGQLNRGNVYYVSSPTSGTITPGTTAVTFTQRAYPPLVFGGTTHNTGYATTGALTPATVTQSGNVLTGGALGALVADGHTMALGETLLVKDQTSASQNGTYKVTIAGAAGTGTPVGVSYATTTSLPANTDNAGVLTATANGALPTIDGITPAVNDTLLVKDEGNGASNGIYTVTAVGVKGTGPTLGATVCATTAALPANTNSSGVLTASAFGSINSANVDGCTFATGDRVLVKNEAASQNNGVYTVTQLGTGNGTSHAAAKVGTTGALPANTASGGVLTATNWGVLPSIDGQTVAAGDRVVVMNETTQANNGIYTVTSAGTGTNVVHTAVRAATTGSLPTNTNTLGVLNPSAFGGLSIDGVAVSVGDRVLVKNEVTQANNGIYTVTSAGLGVGNAHNPVRLATATALPTNTGTTGVLTASGYGPLSVDSTVVNQGDRVLVKNEANGANNGIYVLTTQGTGGTTAHTASRAATIAALPANTNTAGVLTATNYGPLGNIDGVAVTAGDRVLVKNEVTQANNGVYTVTSTGVNGAVHTAAVAATTAGLPGYTVSGNVLTSSTYLTLNIDGVTFSTGTERVLVKNEVNQQYNGIYTVTNGGAGIAGGTTHTAVKAATTGALPANTGTAGTITETLGGPLVVDGLTLAVNDRVLLMNEGTQSNNGIYVVTTAGLGTTTFASGGAVVAATTGTLPGYTRNTTAHTLTGTTGTTTLTIDGVTIANGNRVLIKNEGTSAADGIYTKSTSGSNWVLTRAADTLTGGLQVSVTGGTSNGGKTFYISTPASGSITLETTSLTFTLSPQVVLQRASDANSAGSLKPGDVVPVNTGGTANGGKTFYISTPASGTITLNTTAIGFSVAAKWVLTRATDADATGELLPNDQIPITGGSVNGNSGFYISSPTSPPITINTTAMSWSGASKWVLTRAADTINPGDQFPIQQGGTNANTTYYLSSPTTGPITLNSTALGFSLTSVWVLTRDADANGAGDLTGGDTVPVTNGLTNAGVTFYISTPGTGVAVTINTTATTWSPSAKWQLTRALDTFAPGDQVPITQGTVNAGTTYYLSSPTSGLIVVNVTALSFSLSSKWSLTRATDADGPNELNAGDMVAITSGTTNGGKTFYVSTPSTGTVTINTTPVAFSQASKWVLTRATDADQSSELVPSLQVPVTGGATNAGKTYYISSPASGTISVNSTAITFSLEVPWQLTRKAPYTAAGGGLVPGLQVTVSSGTTNGGKTYFVSSPSSGSIAVDSTTIVFTLGAAWQLTRTTDADTTGEITPGMEVQVANGAINGGRVFYVSSPTNGSITINSTGITFSYGLPSMMAPVISPDGTKVAYVNGDADVDGGLTETGWRRGLSMFSFDQPSMTLSNKKRLINNWNATTAGMAVKWPFFEGDSRSLLYVETSPNEYCSAAANAGNCGTVTNDSNYATVSCSGTGSTLVDTNIERACFQAAYGSMSPTTRGYWPGRIYSIDTQATTPSSTRAELANLDNAQDSTDAGKAYQPTMLPFTAGGKRWVIFTSPRAYGNQFNQKSSAGVPTDLSCAASMLWVAAVDDQVPDGHTDRSHQAFFMPGQQVAKITATTHYVNERGYLVPSPCKANGVSCSVNSECCGAATNPATSACRVPTGWDPSTGAPAKTCQALSGTCSAAGQSCSVDSDCCGGASCVNFACGSAGMQYSAATFTREYVASCPSGQLPVWTLYSYHATTPDDSSLIFSAQSSNDLSTLDAATVVGLGTSTVDLANTDPAATIDVGSALDAGMVSKNLTYLRILVKLVPSTNGESAPTLHDWTMTYSCTDQL
ncbi:MAG TPA: hypothetical protein VMI54_00870 [Polyangiaceae bacterium]|nr:hypothetical protein [Polyangiaceae bacterium]